MESMDTLEDYGGSPRRYKRFKKLLKPTSFIYSKTRMSRGSAQLMG